MPIASSKSASSKSASSKSASSKSASSKSVSSKSVQPVSLFNRSKIIKMYKNAHPDGYMSNAAKETAIGLNLKKESAMHDVLYLAGQITRYERMKRTTSVDDVETAFKIYKRGTVVYNKKTEKLDNARKSMA
jgi:hypothetical protein